VISPLVCQSIIATGVPWYRFYYGSLILSGFNILFLAVTFKPTPTEVFKDRQKVLNDTRRLKTLYLLSDRSSPVDKVNSSEISAVKLDVVDRPRSGKPGSFGNDSDYSSFLSAALRFALTMPYQWALSFFIMLYCGRLDDYLVWMLYHANHFNSETLTQGFVSFVFHFSTCFLLWI